MGELGSLCVGLGRGSEAVGLAGVGKVRPRTEPGKGRGMRFHGEPGKGMGVGNRGHRSSLRIVRQVDLARWLRKHSNISSLY